MEKPLTTGEIAEYCHVTHRAVLKWVEEGKIKAYRTPGNHSRVKIDDFLDFLQKYNMPVPDIFKGKISTKKRILIVDDDFAMVSSIKRVLMLENQYELDEAYDGFTAGEKFADFKPDLVILDIKMPKLDGYQVCKHIRSKSKAVKILVISGVVEVEGAKKVIDLGANDYMAKPFDNSDLKERIVNLLEH